MDKTFWGVVSPSVYIPPYSGFGGKRPLLCSGPSKKFRVDINCNVVSIAYAYNRQIYAYL